MQFLFTAMLSTERCTVRKVLEDFAVCDWWRYSKALSDVKLSQIEYLVK